MRNEIEITKELEQIKNDISIEFRKENEKEKKGEPTNYDLFHKLCRKERNLKEELEISKRYNVKVGDGVTINLYSDAEAGTIIARTKTTLTIQKDKATLKDNWKPEIEPGGFVGRCINNNTQEYNYEKDPNGIIYKAYWSNNKGRFIVNGCLNVSVGRHEFYDYNF